MYEFCLLILFSEFLQIPEDAACAVVALSWARTWRRNTRYANFYCWAFSPLSHLTAYRGLRAVNLTCCEHLRVAGLRHLPPELQVLDLTLCHPVDLAPVSRFTQLRELKLRYCSLVPPSGFLTVFHQCHQLTYVDLAGCDGVNHAVLAALAQSCSHLIVLVLRNCVQVRDAWVVGTLCHLREMKYLSVLGCNRVTAAAVAVLSRTIETVDARYCYDIDCIVEGRNLFLLS